MAIKYKRQLVREDITHHIEGNLDKVVDFLVEKQNECWALNYEDVQIEFDYEYDYYGYGGSADRYTKVYLTATRPPTEKEKENQRKNEENIKKAEAKSKHLSRVSSFQNEIKQLKSVGKKQNIDFSEQIAELEEKIVKEKKRYKETQA